MKKLKIKIALIYNFILPALLINSVGVVTLQLITSYGVSKQAVGWLGAFKDISILLGSFILASFIPKMGYKKSLIIGVSLEIIACLLMALAPSFVMARIFFVLVGVSFALIKVSIYSSVGLFVENKSEHASFISILEGFFMLGIFGVFLVFGYFADKVYWNNVYWVLLGASIVGLILAAITNIGEGKLQCEVQSNSIKDSFVGMFALLLKIAVWFFIGLAFFYVFVEQGITTWLPTYNNGVLHISKNLSDYVTALLPIGIVVGRLAGGIAMRYIDWHKVLTFCTVMCVGILVLLIFTSSLIMARGQSIQTWTQFPLAVYLIFFIGLFMGPIYPTLCSSILSSLPLRLHSGMVAIIMVFSALGGTIGARIMASFFGGFGGLTAFEVPIVPLIVLLILVWPYYFKLKRVSVTNDPN
jgi:fucose permease